MASRKVSAFLRDIEAVCREHGLALSHEDRHGRFEVVVLNEEVLIWLKDAANERKPPATKRPSKEMRAAVASLTKAS